jgi:hypothetical protein
MDDYIDTLLGESISGIEARHWIEFFKVFADSSDNLQVKTRMGALLRRHPSSIDEERADQIVEHIWQVHRLLDG